MLRVITQQNGDTYRLVLHGRLAQEWVPVLERHWRGVAAAAPSAEIVLVLSEVDFVDPGGEDLLRRMLAAGVELRASGCMNRHLVDTLNGRGPDGPPRRLAARRPRPPGEGGEPCH